MGDDVVQLAGDAGALLQQRTLAQRLAVRLDRGVALGDGDAAAAQQPAVPERRRDEHEHEEARRPGIGAVEGRDGVEQEGQADGDGVRPRQPIGRGPAHEHQSDDGADDEPTILCRYRRRRLR